MSLALIDWVAPLDANEFIKSGEEKTLAP